MGKGQIISGGTDGQYSVKLLYDRTKSQAALDQVNRWITAKEEQIDKYWDSNPEKLPALKLALESLKKWKAYYESIPEDPTVDAWCADLSEELTGEVATVEINGDPDQVLVRPGYTDQAAFDMSRDGQLQHIKAMTPEQWFYNAAMAPGWKKWMPTYRVGTITSLNGDTCSVSLDAATTEIVNAGDRSINASSSHSDVGIEYMECNGAAFEVGDRVVVEYRNRHKWEDETPVVIGFESEPKSCRDLMFISVAPDNYIEFYDYNDKDESVTLIRRVDARPYLHGSVSEQNRGISIIDVCQDANMLIICGCVTDWRGYVLEPENVLYGLVNQYTDVAIPIDFYGLDRMDKGLATSWLLTEPLAQQVYSDDGMQVSITNRIYQGYCIYFDLPLYKLENDVLMQQIATNMQAVAIGICGDKVFRCVIKYDSQGHSTGCYAQITPVVYTGGPYLAQKFLGMNTYDNAHEWFSYNTLQVVAYDNKFYVFSGGDVGLDLLPMGLTVFDMDLNVVHESTLDLPDAVGKGMSRIKVSYLKSQAYMIFRIGTFNNLSDPSPTTSPCFFLNPDTFIIEKSVSLPFSSRIPTVYENNWVSSFAPPAFIAINAPRTNYLLEKINEYRFTDSGRSFYYPSFGTYHQTVKHLGYSRRLERMAKDHATWCTSTGRVQHEGADGRLSTARCLDYGFRYLCVGENLAFINTLDFPTRESQLDEALRLWKESPGHNYNLIAQDSTTMGFYASMYPESVHELIIGPGLFNPQTHQYTVTPETITLPPEEYGKLMIIVYNIGQP